MKQRPSHLKRLERKEERSVHEISVQEDQWKQNYMHERTDKQLKKQKKQHCKDEKEGKSQVPKTVDEKNKLQKHRTSVWGERSHHPLPKK